MRTALAVLCTCVLFALGAFVGPAQAGGYRYSDDGYYPRRQHGDVWYSSKCCYKKVIRHVRTVRYVRIDPYRRHGYYGPYRPWREGYHGRPSGYGRPASYTEVYVDGPPPRYSDYPPPRWSGYNGGYGGGYDAYNAAGVDVAPTCYRRRAPVLDGRGGWVWGFKQVCY